jgi:hypothetical protein
MRSFACIVSGVAVIATSASGLAAANAAGDAAAARGFCSAQSSFAGTTITWIGKASKAHSHDWNDPANWSPSTVPDVHQTPATYQTQYVCIGDNKGGGPASVTIGPSASYHLAGVDVGQGAHLTVEPGGRLFLGAASAKGVAPSYVEGHSELALDAGTLGGNETMTVSGTLEWSGHISGKHRLVATQTSSECVFDPSIKTCPGDTTPGGGRTVIAASGKLRVDGTGFGGTDLTDQRVIDNFGTATLSHNGSVTMDNGTQWIDERGSALDLLGNGGIYQGARAGHHALATLTQLGAVTRGGKGTSIVGVPVTFGRKVTPHVTGGSVAFDARAVPVAKARRGVEYGVGGCRQVGIGLCHTFDATANTPQDAVIGTSTAGPKVSRISARLVKAPSKIHGTSVIGRSVAVKAPTEKTTHSTHLDVNYDASMKGVGPKTKPVVFRGKHRITLCRVHGLTAKNTSCVFSAKHGHSGPTKGDLMIVVITIQPKALWSVG